MKTKISYIALLCIILLSSCLKPEVYPLEPIIKYERISIEGNTATLYISFTDGDGDIGLTEADTTGVFSPDKEFHHNLFIEYYEKDDINGWQKGKTTTGEEINFLYRIPNLTPEGNNKALKGEIEVTMEPSYFNPTSSESDTIFYRIRLVDRSLKVSNSVESQVITR